MRIFTTIAIFVCLLAGCRGTVSHDPPVHLNPNMDQQWRFDMQEPNAFFSDNRTMRTPPVGTVAHGTLELDDLTHEHMHEGRINGDWTDQLPAGIQLNAATLNRGEDRFGIYCTPCHGDTGNGDGIVVKRGMAPPKPYSDSYFREFPLGRMVWTLKHGKDNMPSYANQLRPADRWAVATYVRALQISQAANEAQVPQQIRQQNGWPLPKPAPAVAPAVAPATPAQGGK